MTGLAQALGQVRTAAGMRQSGIHKQAAHKPASKTMSVDLPGQRASASAQVLTEYGVMQQGPRCKTRPLHNTQEHNCWLEAFPVSMQVHSPQ